MFRQTKENIGLRAMYWEDKKSRYNQAFHAILFTTTTCLKVHVNEGVAESTLILNEQLVKLAVINTRYSRYQQILIDTGKENTTTGNVTFVYLRI